MRRFALPLVILGSVAVLVALVVLLRSITAESPATPVATAPAKDPWKDPAPPGRAPEPGHISRPPPPVIRPRTEDRAPSGGGGGDSTPVASGSSDAPPGTRLNTKNLQFGLPQLREKIAANAPQVAACIGSAKPSGEATLTFIVAQRGGKVVVEQTDVDREKTTLQDESLLECLHKTALAIQFDGLPREADAIIVTRSISLQDGAVAEDKPVKFSYIR